MNPAPPRCIAIVMAAGLGLRMGQTLPKPYLEIAGKTILRRSIESLLAHPGIAGVRVVIRREHHPLYKQATLGLTLFPPVIGGDTRQESVRRGLMSISDTRQPEWVLIHDAARPLLSTALISRCLEALATYPACLPVLPVADTVKRVENEVVIDTLNRQGLALAQTPQAFHYQPFLEAHQRFAARLFTDDAALMEASGLKVACVAGERENFKITTQDDMTQLAKELYKTMETRSGFGFDVHGFTPHDTDIPTSKKHIKICGVQVPHPQSLKGHSDADVGLHALVDALLGAMAEGDIGQHFPPEDPQWAGADSERFLLRAFEILHSKGGEIVNLDLTIICEKPAISPHREAMRERVAQLLKLDIHRVSVKATTTEKLGFTGRGEGIAAQAMATIRLPL